MLRTLLFVILCAKSFAYQCKNDQNEPVDWFILYKLPRNSHTSNALIKKGLAYAYLTSENYENGWKFSDVSINSTNSIPGYTLQPLYSQNIKNSTYILYNDEPPSSNTDVIRGHSKGVLLSNNTSGFWLVHSVPHYPPEDHYRYPKTGLVYGQSFLCVSFDLKNINNVGKQIQYNYPHVYKSNLPEWMKEKLPNIDAVIRNSFVNKPPWFNLLKLYSLGGKEFVSFAKSKKFGKELYTNWVSPSLDSDLLVETWLNGRGKIPSLCNGTHSTYNVQKIKLSFASFKSSRDHSKWAISTDKNHLNNKWVCIGDINRETTQLSRGGGTVCMDQPEVWKLYHNIITDIEQCS